MKKLTPEQKARAIHAKAKADNERVQVAFYRTAEAH